MAKLNISQAAKAFNKDWKTVDGKCKKGELSHSKNDKGHRLIDVSELVRVFGEPENDSIPASIGNNQDAPEHSLSNSIPNSIALYQDKISTLEEQVQLLRKEKEQDRQEYREREEKLLGIIEKQTLMLEDKREKIGEPEKTKTRPTWLYSPLVVYPVAVGGGLLFALLILRFAADFLLGGLLP